jgi:hypothetical protein
MGTLAFSSTGNYFVGGIALAMPPINLSNIVPKNVVFESLKGSGYIYQWTDADLWPLATTVVVGQCITDSYGNLQVCTVGGPTNASAEPVWNINLGGITIDGGARWTNFGQSLGTVKIIQSAASASPLTEIPSGFPVPASVLSDLISYKAEYLAG